MSNAGILPLTGENFDDVVLTDDATVLVEFTAEWCSTCRAMAPVLSELASDLSGRIQIASLDVDAYPEIADRYGIRGLPTMLLFKRGEVVGQAIGFVPKKQFAERLEPFIEAEAAV